MGKQMVVDKDSLTPIANLFREVLEIPREYQFPLSEFESMINSALGKTAGENYQQGYEDGKSQGTDEAYWQGYSDGTNNGIEIGKEQGYGEGTDNGITIGREQEHTRIWSALQDVTNYGRMFSGLGWKDETFEPEQDIVVVGYAEALFAGMHITDLKGILERRSVKLDLSKATNLYNCFYDCKKLTRLPVLDLSSATNVSYMVFSCNELVSVDKLILGNKVTASESFFRGCPKLTDIEVEGELIFSVNLSRSELLSHDSIVSWMNVLSNTTTGKVLTLSKAAVDKAFETSEGANDGSTSAEWVALVATKPNWTISLV